MTEAETLYKKAESYRKSASVLADAGLWENAFEAAHLSVEIIMKAAISRVGGRYEWTHNLRILAETPVNGAPFLSPVIRDTLEVSKTFTQISSAWRVQYRYEQIPWNQAETQQLIESFERFYVWTTTKFVN